MQRSQTATKPWSRPCSRCGKPTFSDLLDSEGLCDYCREIKSMKASVVRASKKHKTGK